MDIVYCSDDNYVMPCGISMISLLENNKAADFTIHIVGLNLKEESKSLLISNVEKYNNVNILFYEISKDLFDLYNLSLFNSKYLSFATYSRLFLSDILPSNIDKVLYLDCDIIVVGDISELWNIQINNYSVAGVLDMCMYAGLLLINLKYWRDKKVIGVFIDFYKTKIDKIANHDQDIINGVFCDTKLLIPFKFNVIDLYYQTKKRNLFGKELEIKEAIKHPVIIHYTSAEKPWMKQCLHIKNYLYGLMFQKHGEILLLRKK